MKVFYRFLPILLLTAISVSCIRIDDDDFFYDGNNSYNEGQVVFDGISYPLTYADFYRRANVQGGEIWALALSEEFIGSGNTYSDAYLYLEIFRPNGAPLEGQYDMLQPTKFIDYATYYEQVILFDGIPNSYGFYIPNNSFVDGQVRVERFSGNTYYFEVRLRTYAGENLTAWFEGRLQY